MGLVERPQPRGRDSPSAAGHRRPPSVRSSRIGTTTPAARLAPDRPPTGRPASCSAPRTASSTGPGSTSCRPARSGSASATDPTSATPRSARRPAASSASLRSSTATTTGSRPARSTRRPTPPPERVAEPASDVESSGRARPRRSCAGPRHGAAARQRATEMRIVFLRGATPPTPTAAGPRCTSSRSARGWPRAATTSRVLCARHPGRPRARCVDGVRVVRRGGRLTVYLRGLAWLRSPRGRGPTWWSTSINGLPFASPLVRRRGVVALVHHVHREQWRIIYPGLARAGRLVRGEPARCRGSTAGRRS